MACESNQTSKRMREAEEGEYLALTTAERWAANENKRVDNIQSNFFRTVKGKFEDALVALEDAEKDVFAELARWKDRELKKK